MPGRSKIAERAKRGVKKKDQTYSNEPAPKSVVVIIALAILLTIGWIDGAAPFTLKYIECGKPPAIVSPPFAGSPGYVYFPGDPDYRPGFFFSREYECPVGRYAPKG